MDEQHGVLVLDYQNLDFGARRANKRGFVDLHEIRKAADEVSRTLIQERVLFVSDVYWNALFEFKKRYIRAQILTDEFFLEIVPVAPTHRNSRQRLITYHLVKKGGAKKIEDPVDLAMIDYCERRRKCVSALVVASSDGGFARLVKSFGGFVVYYDTPSRKLLQVAQRSVQVLPGRGRKYL